MPNRPRAGCSTWPAASLVASGARGSAAAAAGDAVAMEPASRSTGAENITPRGGPRVAGMTTPGTLFVRHPAISAPSKLALTLRSSWADNDRDAAGVMVRARWRGASAGPKERVSSAGAASELPPEPERFQSGLGVVLQCSTYSTRDTRPSSGGGAVHRRRPDRQSDPVTALMTTPGSATARGRRWLALMTADRCAAGRQERRPTGRSVRSRATRELWDAAGSPRAGAGQPEFSRRQIGPSQMQAATPRCTTRLARGGRLAADPCTYGV